MPTKPRPWPTAASQARDDAIMEITEALREIAPAIRGQGNPLLVLASTIDHLYKALNFLKSVP